MTDRVPLSSVMCVVEDNAAHATMCFARIPDVIEEGAFAISDTVLFCLRQSINPERKEVVIRICGKDTTHGIDEKTLGFLGYWWLRKADGAREVASNFREQKLVVHCPVDWEFIYAR